jgi:hypothetical protein
MVQRVVLYSMKAEEEGKNVEHIGSTRVDSLPCAASREFTVLFTVSSVAKIE